MTPISSSITREKMRALELAVANRCAEIAEKVAREHDLSAINLPLPGFNEANLAGVFEAKAATARRIAALIRAEFPEAK